MTTTKTLLAFLLVLVPALTSAQDSDVRRMFNAGQHAQVMQAADSPHAAPEVIYLAAQSAQKQGNADAASVLFTRLAAMPPDGPWHSIGLSGRQLLANDVGAARDSARKAVAQAGDLADAHYQLGLVLAKVAEWSQAAAAFDRVAEIDPAAAYAHYYGGLMHYRANRPDRMANHFEQFLKLAPNAPERPEVMQIMKTVRGR